MEFTAKRAMSYPHLNRQSFSRILLPIGVSEISYQFFLRRGAAISYFQGPRIQGRRIGNLYSSGHCHSTFWGLSSRRLELLISVFYGTAAVEGFRHNMHGVRHNT